jgi:hypothetical protein
LVESEGNLELARPKLCAVKSAVVHESIANLVVGRLDVELDRELEIPQNSAANAQPDPPGVE